MASYEEDHNVSSSSFSSRTRNNNSNNNNSNDSGNNGNTSTSLSQHLSEFFSLDHDPARGAQRRDFMDLASAMQGLESSPLASELVLQLQQEAEQFMGGVDGTSQGVSQNFLDGLDRINKKKLKPTDQCAICATNYLDDPYPLVVRLPCDTKHHFDLECIGPWLKLHSTCPLCRKNLLEKKEIPVLEDSEEEFDDTYG